MGEIFLSEVVGTGLLTLLGCGVVANVILPRTKGNGGGWLLINFGWGLAVFAGVFASLQSGAHINPAVTLGLWANGADEFAAGVEDITTAETTRYGRGDTHVFALVRRLADEITTLFTKELALLKVETTNSIREAQAGIGSMAAGGAVLYAGFLFLLVSAFLGLSLVMDGWLAALIVGGVVAIIGAIMLASGRSKLKANSFKPEHYQASMRKDQEMIKRNVEEQRNAHEQRNVHEQQYQR